MSRPSRILSAPGLGRALAEIAIIVVGVLIALGADAWWSDRKEAQLTEEFRTALVADLAWDREWYGVLDRWLGDATVGIDSLATAVLDEVDRDPATVDLWLAWSSRLLVGKQRSGAFDELVATGHLALFEDPDLRQAIIAYYSLDVRVEPNIYAVWVERTFFPWNDLIREVGGPVWYGELQRCIGGPSGGEGRTTLAQCVAAHADPSHLERLRATPDAIRHLQNFLTKEWLARARGMQSARDCLAEWLVDGVQDPDVCAGEGRAG